MKLIFWDGTGVCLFAKRLEDGKFRWPKIEDGVMRLTAAQFRRCLRGSIGGEFTQARRRVADDGGLSCDKRIRAVKIVASVGQYDSIFGHVAAVDRFLTIPSR